MQSDAQIRSQIRAALDRFNDLISSRDPHVLAEFVNGDDVMLVGSETGEVAKGRQELQAFFNRVFAREVAFSWEWRGVEISYEADVAWLFADGHVVLSDTEGQQRVPYRISGVLQRQGGRWLWRQYHGAEPASRA